MGVIEEERYREAFYDKDEEIVCEIIHVYSYGFVSRLGNLRMMHSISTLRTSWKTLSIR
jgi:hypothetical protein